MSSLVGEVAESAVEGREGKGVRDGFTTGLGVIAATLGSAVGLGNIWKFPFMTGVNGGAAFIIIYLLSTLLVGLPVMISETMLGRKARADAITTLRKVAPKQLWWLIGASGVLAAFLILAFYTEVAAWVFAYIFKAAFGEILSTNPEVTSAAFGSLISNPVQSLLWQWGVLIVISAIIIAGVSKGIENTTKRLMPVLFLILVMLCIRSLTLPGAAQGLAFLFTPDFSKVTGATVLTAMGLSFFKLSVGMGTMITYGSYFRDDQDIPATTTKVMLADLLVSMLAGIAIFPAVFAFGFEPGAGPSLLFITIPAVFASMPFGNIFMVLFFILAAIAATGAMLSLLEVPVAFLTEKKNFSRVKATLLTSGLLALIGSTAALSNSTLSGVTLFGMTFFDLYDYLTSNILLPVGGLFISIFVGWVWGYKEVKQALSNEGVLNNEKIIQLFFGIVKVVTPILVTVVLLNGLGVIKLG
ncbi:MAG: sodium-dependent transporter [Anaerolineae bacterium]|nr:sodium-dependent transporter [Anaerolineae bacterium]